TPPPSIAGSSPMLELPTSSLEHFFHRSTK
ncbi:hypothetical protein A2U01_0051962, partial [Trifolium medium]|nr:hypothetical protein [Trifolium medium]